RQRRAGSRARYLRHLRLGTRSLLFAARNLDGRKPAASSRIVGGTGNRTGGGGLRRPSAASGIRTPPEPRRLGGQCLPQALGALHRMAARGAATARRRGAHSFVTPTYRTVAPGDRYGGQPGRARGL